MNLRSNCERYDACENILTEQMDDYFRTIISQNEWNSRHYFTFFGRLVYENYRLSIRLLKFIQNTNIEICMLNFNHG